MFSNPLSHAGYPPGVTGTPTTQPSAVRAATAAEAAAGVLTDVYISPATAQSATALDFASPPVTGYGSTTPRPVKCTTLEVTVGPVTYGEGVNMVLGSTSGTKIGTATSQKLGFYNATPIVQPAAGTDLKSAIVNLGLLASGTSPLDLGSGALGSGTHTLTDGANVVVGTTTGTKIGTSATQKLGFWNASPVVQQTQGAITNNVTVGGTTGIIEDFTDLTVYANDAAAIRNDIYQLALALKGCIDALRLYGMLG